MSAWLFLLFLLFDTLASAKNQLRIVNGCPYNLYHWAVGPAESRMNGFDGDRITVPSNSTAYSALLDTQKLGAGVSHKIRDLPKYYEKPAGIIQMEYHYEPLNDVIWYDFSMIDCDMTHGSDSPMYCPFVAGGVKVHFPEEPSCMVARCQNGVCENTYHEHGSWKGEPSFRCRAGIDLVVEFCTDGPGERTFGERPEYTQPIPKAELTVSPNGACGPSSKYTCKDSKWGQCCSEYGYCGSTDAYCSNGCQDNFGLCGPQQVASSSSAKPASSSNVYALKKTTSASSSKVSSTAKKSSSASQSVFTTTQTVTETVRMPVATTVYKTVYNNGTACGNQTNFITSSLPATGSPPSPGASTTSRGLFKKWMKQHDHGHAHGHGR